MKILASTHSNFPRVGDSREQQRLRRAYASLEKGKMSEDEFNVVQNELIEEVIGIQESSGCDIVTDGMIRWYDHASHIAKNLRGFKINGLLRFFDTNYYYRQPVAGDDIAEGDGGLAEESSFLAAKSNRLKKVILLGPYSLAMMSQNKSSMNFEAFSRRMAELLAAEVKKIASTGIDYVQIEEPAFVRNPENFDLFKESIEQIALKKGSTKIVLTFYFGNCEPLLERLREIPADMFGFDLTYSPSLLDRLRSDGFPGQVSLGILDGRNTKIESPDKVAASLENVLGKLGGDECHITTSSGLEFLPRDYAISKLKLAAKVVGILNG
jgi:5-methyltetrahydropteroyltriglutamate--homocysteine methyltransferase